MLRAFLNLKLVWKIAIPMAMMVAIVLGIVWSALTGIQELSANTEYALNVSAAR